MKVKSGTLAPNQASPSKMFESLLWKVVSKWVLSVLGNHCLSCSGAEWCMSHLLLFCGLSLVLWTLSSLPRSPCHRSTLHFLVSASVISLTDPGNMNYKNHVPRLQTVWKDSKLCGKRQNSLVEELQIIYVNNWSPPGSGDQYHHPSWVWVPWRKQSREVSAESRRTEKHDPRPLVKVSISRDGS